MSTLPNRRVLVVDDNVDAARSLGVLIAQLGYDVQIAHDGLAALEFGRGTVPHVVFLDINMPGADGFEVVRRLRADPRLSRTRFVALSGHAEPEYQERAREVGFSDYFLKPLRLDLLPIILAK